ncbi:hypothetical protein [Streptomyces goshikiensis]|uniref:hypothetical protein n=1 Tax=Streptomyces goshikiensis TaxID=1942 RepID=UPI003653F428
MPQPPQPAPSAAPATAPRSPRRAAHRADATTAGALASHPEGAGTVPAGRHTTGEGA